MKITGIDTFVVKGMVAPMCFCAIRTDEGLTGYAEYGYGLYWRGMVGLVQDLAENLIGQDPMPVQRHLRQMERYGRTAYGGATQMAIAGIELALWDLKGKALGVPVYDLFGGPLRDRQLVYFSHLGFYAAAYPDRCDHLPPLRTWDDLAAYVELAKGMGYRACKTNIVYPGDPPYALPWAPRDRMALQVPPTLVAHAVRQIGLMRQVAGDDLEIGLDIVQDTRTEGAIRLAQALEPFDLMWLELDNMDPEALTTLKASTRTPICSGEQHLGPIAAHPYLASHAVDALKVDIPWQGFLSALETANLARLYETNVVPHNFNGHLSNFQAMHLCACAPNVRICEVDPHSAPWRDELFTVQPEIVDGHMMIPTGPGWGTELNEDAARRWAYQG